MQHIPIAKIVFCHTHKGYHRIYWFRLSRSALIFEYLLFGLKNRGLLILLHPDVSPASVACIFRGLGSWVVARSLLTDAGETSGRRSISRPWFLSPKSKHLNTYQMVLVKATFSSVLYLFIFLLYSIFFCLEYYNMLELLKRLQLNLS